MHIFLCYKIIITRLLEIQYFTMKFFVGGYFKKKDGQHIHKKCNVDNENLVYFRGRNLYYDFYNVKEMSYKKFIEFSIGFFYNGRNLYYDFYNLDRIT